MDRILKCATCGSTTAPLDLAHADGACGVCGSETLVAATPPELVSA